MASNTTEAGITYDPSCKPDQLPPTSFPAKATVLLYNRFKAGTSRALSSFPAS
jgi:tagaturonate reductase